MERWRNKVAVVTGAASGIGLATAKRLVLEGLNVVGFDIQLQKMQTEMSGANGPGKFFARECDVSKEKDVDEAFNFVKEVFQTVHVLFNNAGIFKYITIGGADVKELQDIINVNLMGVLYCSKQALKLMRENDHEAHIINMNSVSGHKVPNFILPNGAKMNFNVYSPTKYAITSLSEVLRQEIGGRKIRITNLGAGFTVTDLGKEYFEHLVEKYGNSFPLLNPEDIADAVVYVVGTPNRVQITEMMIKPLEELF